MPASDDNYLSGKLPVNFHYPLQKHMVRKLLYEHSLRIEIVSKLLLATYRNC